MRIPLVVASVCALSVTAHAELTDVELEARGESLAKAGRYAEAIEAFKAADQQHPRASHACLIALAYARRDLWFQSEIWFETCNDRARPDDPKPEWYGELAQQIEHHTHDPGVAAVTLESEPAIAGVKFALVDFPEAVFAARTLHLPRGHHTIVATATGYRGTRDVDIDDASPRHVVVTLHAMYTRPNSTRTTLLVTGGVLLGLGTISYGVMGASYLKLRDSPEYNNGISTTAETTYKVARVTAIGGWALGAGLIVTGLLLHRTVESATVAAAPLPGGALVTIGWQR